MKRQLSYLVWTLAYYGELLSIKALGFWYFALYLVKNRKLPRKLSRKELADFKKFLRKKSRRH